MFDTLAKLKKETLRVYHSQPQLQKIRKQLVQKILANPDEAYHDMSSFTTCFIHTKTPVDQLDIDCFTLGCQLFDVVKSLLPYEMAVRGIGRVSSNRARKFWEDILKGMD